jgi:hypothetical protein
VELPFRINFSAKQKVEGYEFPTISKQQNVKYFNQKNTITKGITSLAPMAVKIPRFCVD